MGLQNLSGHILGQYELRELLGIGGMGAVYRAHQVNLDRSVALKVLAPHLAAEAGYVERFYREARTAAALEHTHIVPIYDYGVQGDLSYVAMRLLTGGTLNDRLQQREGSKQPLPSLGETAHVLNQLASALDYAHSQGVIHRDVKPSNVMFDNQGNAFLVDFGIAKILEATHSMTATGTAMGTPSYMPPEQWRSDELTPAADQYALAVMIYALITGRVPFEASTPYGLMHKHLNDAPTPPQTYRSEIPSDVTLVLERALAKRSSDRFPSVTAFAQAFERAIGSQGGEATGFFVTPLRGKPRVASLPISGSLPKASGAAVQRFSARDRVIAGLAALVVLLIGVVAVLFATSGGDDKSTDQAVAERLTQTRIAQVEDEQRVSTNVVQTFIALTPSDTLNASKTPAPTVTLNPSVVPMLSPESAEPERDEQLSPGNQGPIIEVIPSNTPANTPTFTPTDEPTVTLRPSPTATLIPSPTLTSTATTTATPTQTPSTTFTPTPLPTNTPLPTATYTRTATPTLLPPPTATTTFTLTPTATATRTPTRTATATSTRTPSPTATRTPRPTATRTPRPTATYTRTPWPTATRIPRPTATRTPRPTATYTRTPWPTATRTPRPTATAANICTITSDSNVNLRSGPGTDYPVRGTLASGRSVSVAGQATGTDGYTWWKLVSNEWVRSDIVGQSGNCRDVPIVQVAPPPVQPTLPNPQSQASPPSGFFVRPSDGLACTRDSGNICLGFDDGYNWLVPIPNGIGLCSWTYETIEGYSVKIGNMCDGRHYAHVLGTNYSKGPY